jgi:hypothetical protein
LRRVPVRADDRAVTGTAVHVVAVVNGVSGRTTIRVLGIAHDEVAAEQQDWQGQQDESGQAKVREDSHASDTMISKRYPGVMD